MSSIRLATQTLKAIDEKLEADQGNSFRHHLGLVMPHIGDAYRQDTDGFRSHMGASMIGGECGRAIWYDFRWATIKKFPGRILRLFNRGHLEEARFIALLLMIGCEVYQQDAEGKQFRITHANGHFGGSGDGIAIGLPDLPPGTAALSEFKTHGEKSFLALVKSGMRDSKFEHYVQMQCYMYKMGIPYGFYLAVNKNTDALYGEIIILDKELAMQFLDRGETLTKMQTAPDRISKTPGFYKCTFCDHKPVCFLKAVPAVNCRTCAYSMPSDRGTEGDWVCRKFDSLIPKEVQLTGCVDYVRSKEI